MAERQAQVRQERQAAATERAREQQQAMEEARRSVLEAMLDKIRTDRFPSSSVMDEVEDLLAPEDVPAYVEVLRAKVAGDTYPSMSMIRRLVALTAR